MITHNDYQMLTYEAFVRALEEPFRISQERLLWNNGIIRLKLTCNMRKLMQYCTEDYLTEGGLIHNQ